MLRTSSNAISLQTTMGINLPQITYAELNLHIQKVWKFMLVTNDVRWTIVVQHHRSNHVKRILIYYFHPQRITVVIGYSANWL